MEPRVVHAISELDSILPLLTVGGLLCAMIAGVFGVFHDYKKEHTSGLKGSGKFVLAVTILGGVVGILAAVRDAREENLHFRDENEKTQGILTQLDRGLHPLREVRIFYTLQVDAPDLLRSLHERFCPPPGQNFVLVQEPAALEHFKEIVASAQVNLSFHITHEKENAFSLVPCSAGEVAGCLDLNFSSGDPAGNRLDNRLLLNTCAGKIAVGGGEFGYLWGPHVASTQDLSGAQMAVFGSAFFEHARHPATIVDAGVAFDENPPLGGNPTSFWKKAKLIDWPDWPAYTHTISDDDIKKCCSLIAPKEGAKGTGPSAKS
jgi:hypothetical protein